MNRGFGTEEAIELVLTPSMHYELIGSNNPDANLTANKLSIPRIGSGDDCSILLQVENGSFSHTDIVNCLSKSTKASVATKLEEVPVTAQQRVGLLMFVGLVGVTVLGVFKGMDYYFDSKKKEVAENAEKVEEARLRADLQGWSISKTYTTDSNVLYKSFVAKEIEVTVGRVESVRTKLRAPISVSNSSSKALTLNLSISATLDQASVPLPKRLIFDKLVMPGDKLDFQLEAVVPSEASRQNAVLEFFLTEPDGESLKGSMLVRSPGR